MKTRDDLRLTESKGDGEALCAVGAELLLCENIDLVGVPTNARSSYVKERIRTLAPFRCYESYSEVATNRAIVWIWDGALAEETALALVPEHLLFRAPDGGGRRAVERRVRHVWFLEYWNKDDLVACRRFLAQPSDDDRRAMSEEFDAGFDTVWLDASAVYAPKPRGEIEPLSAAWFRRPVGVTSLCLTVAVVALLVSGGRYVGWLSSAFAKERVIETAVRDLDPLLLLRSEVIRLNTAASAVESWLRRPTVLVVAADFESAIGEQYEELLEWSFDGDRIRAEVRSADDRTREMIERLQASRRFEGVLTRPGDKSDITVIEARVSSWGV